jgi:hypothetical protein
MPYLQPVILISALSYLTVGFIFHGEAAALYTCSVHFAIKSDRSDIKYDFYGFFTIPLRCEYLLKHIHRS